MIWVNWSYSNYSPKLIRIGIIANQLLEVWAFHARIIFWNHFKEIQFQTKVSHHWVHDMISRGRANISEKLQQGRGAFKRAWFDSQSVLLQERKYVDNFLLFSLLKKLNLYTNSFVLKSNKKYYNQLKKTVSINISIFEI